MAGRLSVACVSFLAVLAFLLLFGSGTHVEATTYKMGYSSELSCDGPDKTYGTVDDSCVKDAAYEARGEGLHADVVSYFDVWLADPKYSMYSLLATMGTPSTWQISTDEEIPDGAYVGDMVAVSTLALFGSQCTGTNIVTIPLHDCSTDTTDTIVWNGAISGENLTYGFEGGLPAGCLKYPQHVLDIVGDVKPRARYYGFTTVIDGMPPTQLNFLMFNPGQLSGQPAGGTSSAVPPRDDFTDDLGYINFTVLDNPNIPAEATSALDELCTPLGTTTNLLGLTGGQSFLNADVTAGNVPPAAGTFWVHPEVDAGSCVVGDCCGDSVDNDTDGKVDEMCGFVRVTNPMAGTGIYGTGSHMAGGYSESYRDADGDTIANNEDECPYDDDDGVESSFTHIDTACGNKAPCTDSHPGGTAADADGDGWRNQADNCPCVFQTSQANDADDDDIGDECDTASEVPDGHYANDLQWGSICIEADDSDGDGWCDATEDLDGYLGPGNPISDKTVKASVPEWRALEPLVRAEYNPPGAAPGSCSNRGWYDTHRLGGPETDDDLDGYANMFDANACPGMNLDLTSAPSDIDPLVLNCPDVVGSLWHELWPTYSNVYEATSHTDQDGDTTLSQGDQIDFNDGHDYHVDEVTITLWLSLKPEKVDEVAVEFYASGEDMQDAYHNPVSTQWHEIWPVLSNEYHLQGWSDNTDGYLSESDQIILRDKDTGVVTEWHVDKVTIDIIVTQKLDGDTDGDGVLDVDDNCPNQWNPTQLDTDGDGKPGQQPNPAIDTWGGDACDVDDDGDDMTEYGSDLRTLDVDEWAAGTDPKDVCSPRGYDNNFDGLINVLDLNNYKPIVLIGKCAPY